MNTDPNEFFIRLLEGRIPESVPDINPAECAGLLIRAIDYYEEQRLSADFDKAAGEEWLQILQEVVLTEPEAWAEDLMFEEQLRREIDHFSCQISEAGSRKEACENMLMILLKDHPELKERLETEESP